MIAPPVGEVASLSPRARNLALWLCDLANPALGPEDRDASADVLLREVPDHWTGVDLVREARRIRAELGPRATHRQWLSAMGWLVGEGERLPLPAPRSIVPRARIAQTLAAVLREMGGV